MGGGGGKMWVKMRKSAKVGEIKCEKVEKVRECSENGLKR